MSDPTQRSYAVTPELAWRLATEIRALREGFVADEVNGQLGAAEGNLTRDAIDKIEAAARITWTRGWPALDSLLAGLGQRLAATGGAA